MKIINIATFPPPIGGVSCFLKRLKVYTDNIPESIFTYVDVSGKEKKRKRQEGIICCSKCTVFFYLLHQKSSLIVFHSNSVGHLLLQKFFYKKHRFIYFTHGESILKKQNRTGWRNKVLKTSVALVTPTEELFHKVKEIFGTKCKVINIPFIIYPQNVVAYKSKLVDDLRDRMDFVFSGYANSLIQYNGEDLYGVDMMIEVLNQLNKKVCRVGLVLLITDVNDSRKFDDYKTKIHEYQLDDKIVILTERLEEASALYLSSNAYLRPTNTDGDSFSIWEALHLGVPVLTSDATQRPQGCIIFRNRNIEDLAEKAEKLIQDYKTIKRKTESLSVFGNEKQLIDFLLNISKT